MATIGLCMIVKNEAPIIRRCFDSVIRLVDYIFVVDTGSTDGTQEVIRAYLKEKSIEGEVIDEPWKDFSYNRTFALTKLKEKKHIDYSLMIDADNIIICNDDFDVEAFKSGMTRDIYEIRFQTHGILYWLPRLISQRLDVRYRGVLHEYLEYPKQYTRAFVEGFMDQQVQDSTRNKNPKKYQDDAVVLEKALETETDPFLISRYTFYLAQSYRDSKEEDEKSLARYLERANQGYWIEERFISLYEAAKLKIRLRHSEAEVIQTFLSAYEIMPNRAEPLHGAMRYCREKKKSQQAYILGKQAMTIAYPETGLFVERWVYDYGILDEFSIAAEWAGHYQEAFEACLKLIVRRSAPVSEMPRIIKNMNFIIEKLGVPELKKVLPGSVS
jgi:glycosyltransferase involved in cell wall biosynthesis